MAVPAARSAGCPLSPDTHGASVPLPHSVQTADYDAEGLYKCLAKMDKYLLDPSYMPVDGDTCRNEKVISY